MKTIHLGYESGHLYFWANAANNREIKIVVDTGACTTISFKNLLINQVKKHNTYVGIGNSESNSEGLLITDVLSTKASYVAADRDYDVLLGLDWMMQHKVKIDILAMTMDYE